MLFAEPGHPYDDPADPPEWAWRIRYFELLYHRSIKTLTLSYGPRYSLRYGKSCRTCYGNGHVPRRVGVDAAEEAQRRCPTCPARRTVFEHVPIWPVRTIDRLRTWRMKRRRPPTQDDASSDRSSLEGRVEELPF